MEYAATAAGQHYSFGSTAGQMELVADGPTGPGATPRHPDCTAPRPSGSGPMQRDSELTYVQSDGLASVTVCTVRNSVTCQRRAVQGFKVSRPWSVTGLGHSRSWASESCIGNAIFGLRRHHSSDLNQGCELCSRVRRSPTKPQSRESCHLHALQSTAHGGQTKNKPSAHACQVETAVPRSLFYRGPP